MSHQSGKDGHQSGKDEPSIWKNEESIQEECCLNKERIKDQLGKEKVLFRNSKA
jgi:hypothetical protein